MAKLTFSRRARTDLRKIGDWIARDNPSRAITFVQQLRSACEGLADFPLAYPIIGALDGSPVHKRSLGDYLIFYEIEDRGIRILTIVHGARDVDALLD